MPNPGLWLLELEWASIEGQASAQVRHRQGLLFEDTIPRVLFLFDLWVNVWTKSTKDLVSRRQQARVASDIDKPANLVVGDLHKWIMMAAHKWTMVHQIISLLPESRII